MKTYTQLQMESLSSERLREWVLSDYILRETKALALRILERRTFEDAYEQGQKNELEESK